MPVILPEIEQIEKRIDELKGIARVSVIAESKLDKLSLPIYKVSFGTDDPKAPVLGLVGGVHGLERIGAQVCVSLFQMFTQLMLWDKTVQKNLEHFRIFFIPTVNPIGLHKLRRANPRGVDLMRNAPIEAAEKPIFLVGGHRYSSKLPWYRGEANQMEVESQAVVDAFRAETFQSSRVMSVDFHSGFGLIDRLWFPYATTVRPFPDLPYMHAFKELFEKTHPHHFYILEPQSKSYTTHGDLWDYLYQEYQKQKPQNGIYLPLTLEMGSWMWVKKNPFQIFSSHGPFNPVKHHRFKRVLRRHNTLFEFLIRSLITSEAWTNLSEDQLHKHNERGLKLWYGQHE